MRTKILLTALLFLATHAKSQVNANLSQKDLSILGQFGKEFDVILKSYNCVKSSGKPAKIVSDDAFDTLFTPVFGKVIFGNNDLVKQGSAGTFSLNQFESKFSLSYSFAYDKKNPVGKYHTVGFNAVSTSKNFQFYSKNEWQQGFSVNYTFTHPVFKGLFFKPTDCGELIKKRQVASVYWLKDIRNILLTDVGTIDANIATTQGINISGLTDLMLVAVINSAPGNTKKNYDDALKAKTDWQYLQEVVTNKEVKRYADSIATKYDKESVAMDTYHLFWLNYTVKPEFRSIKTYDTAIASLAGIRKKDFYGLLGEISLNYFRQLTKTLWFGQLGIGARNTNYLEGKKPADLKTLIVPVSTTTDIIDNEQAIVVDVYEKYKKNFLLFTPYLGGNVFFGKKRVIGLEIFGSGKFGFESNEIEFHNLYTIRSGLLFSMNGKTDLGKTTFGLIAQWEDVPFKGEKTGEYFTFSLRFGIPFNN